MYLHIRGFHHEQEIPQNFYKVSDNIQRDTMQAFEASNTSRPARLPNTFLQNSNIQDFKDPSNPQDVRHSLYGDFVLPTGIDWTSF